MDESINSNKKVVFVLGPTAAGKSHWALTQALRYPDSCIVNCDSVQIYKYVNIGSSKPTPAELKLRPHYLYNEIDFPESVTAGEYERRFFKLLDTITETKVFVVGGTGFYFQAIEKGMYPVTMITENAKIESDQLILEKGFGYLHQWIAGKDPEYAQKISVNDHYRIERAFQLMRSEDRSMTQIQKEFLQTQRVFPFPLLKIGVTDEKEKLREVVARRTSEMVKNGLLDEVRGLITRGMRDWDPLSSVGYKEAVQWLDKFPDGGQKLDALCDEISLNTMKLIKKQKTWFQRDKGIGWIHRDQTELRSLDEFLT